MVAITLQATFSTAGPFQWTCPAGVTSVVAAVTGGGGGGAAVSATSGSNGGGGGGGGTALEPTLGVTPGTVYSGTVGAAGLAGTPASKNGGNGGNSIFTGDSISVLASGGIGGVFAGGGSGAGGGGLGGTAGPNTVAATGGTGGDGVNSVSGGGGGGAAGASTTTGYPGNAGALATPGAATLGTYPGGAGGAPGTGAGVGSNGSAPGGGGGGNVSTGGSRAGGAGANGQVTITWVQNDPVVISANTVGGVYTFQAPSGTTLVNAQAVGAGGGGFNPATTTTAARVGCTSTNEIYHSGDRLASGTTFDTNVGRPMCLQVQKFFFQETGSNSISQFTTANIASGVVSANAPQQVLKMWQKGCIPILCVRPNRGYATGTDEFALLQNAIGVYQAAGITTIIVILWQEANDNDTSTGLPYFSTPAVYQAYWNHYVQAVPSNCTLAYSAGSGQWSQVNAYCPLAGPILPTIFSIDWYGTAFAAGHFLTYPTSSPSYPGPFDFADTNGLIPAVYEFGITATGTVPPAPFTWDSYINGPNGLLTVINARKTAGRAFGHTIYFNGTSGSPNEIDSSTQLEVPDIQLIYDTLSPSVAVGGAGGGGGEFAQETSLGITDGNSYVFAVGAGNPLLTGGNTTIAGDTVTVTAHGGAVATTAGTGGLAGSGSTNSIHEPGGAGGNGGITGGGGGGGGGSGGLSSAGSPGQAGAATTGGAGGTVVPGGGPGGGGGNTGLPGHSGGSPGGGGGGSGANGVTQGDAGDGQIILSGFQTHPAGPGSFGLGPLAFGGTGSVNVSSYGLAPLAFSAQGLVANILHVQDSPVSSGSPNLTLTYPVGTTAGNTLIAYLIQNTKSSFVAPNGWIQDVAESTPAGVNNGHLEVWRLPGYLNPGGITSVVFTGAVNCRGAMSEFSSPPGTVLVFDGSSPAVINGGGSTTSFPLSVTGVLNGGDLGIALFENQFSAAPTGQSWTNPSGWTLAGSTATGAVDTWAAYWRTGLSTGTVSVTGTYSTSTNQTGYAAALLVYTTNFLVSSSGGLALPGLAFAAAGSAVLGPGQIASSGGFALAPIGFQSPSLANIFGQNGNSPLPIKVEILINGAWADISDYVLYRDNISITGRGRPDEASTAQPAQMALTLNNRDGTFSPYNPNAQFYPFLTRNTQIRVSVVNAVTPLGAWYTGYRFWGEVPSWPVQWDPSGTDVYVQIAAAGVLQRMRQSKFSASPLKRYYTNLINNLQNGGNNNSNLPNQSNAPNPNPSIVNNPLAPAAYWPCEDGIASLGFSSGIPGGSPMTFTGTPFLAADNSVPGSAPFAQLSSSVWTGVAGSFTAGGVTYSVPGTYQWLCPAGVTSITVQCWGAGGGGANGFFGPGGGGGEYAEEITVGVTPGKLYTLVVGAGGSGGGGAFNPGAGSDGGSSSFSGDSLTVIAHGGSGAPKNSSTGFGKGGSGSKNTTHHSGGNGSDWNNGNGGNGGGGSGGSSAAGNNGSGAHGANNLTGGNGATAVTGGGPGGMGGNGGISSNTATDGMMPSPGPGGGGGGGGFNGYNKFGKAGGNGYAGQVQISFGPSQVPSAPAVVMRFVLDEPGGSPGGGVDQSIPAQMTMGGTIATCYVRYHQASGGGLQAVGLSSTGATLFDTGTVSFNCNGHPQLVSVELVQTAPGKISWKLTSIAPGATSVTATKTGTVNGTLGSVIEFQSNVGTLETGDIGVGHVTIQYAVDPILNLSQAFNAYQGELAATRILRLCAEQAVPCLLQGNVADTPQMGPQITDILVNILQDCETADLGQIFENRDSFGLGYATRVSMENQSTAAVLDYSRAQIVLPLNPTNDDALTRNDIIITRGSSNVTGSSYEVQDNTGPMSVNDPPNGVGLYAYTGTVNLFSDSQLPNYANWLLNLGTIDEFRYPVITIDLTRSAVADGTFGAVAGLDITDFVQIINTPIWLPGPINQLCFGFAETLSNVIWTIEINAVPEDPWTNPSGFPTW